MNSYFASVEQQANPHLRGLPVGVCEHLGGIIIAPSVEAKRLGIKLGTPVWEARKIYHSIVLLPVDPDKIRSVTARFLRILADYSDEVKKSSIDEAFVDLSGVCRDYDEALLIALEIKQRLRFEVGEWVSCSIGIGPNKLVAKIAADLGGGDIDRICAVTPEDVPGLYERLNLTDVPGIGRRLERSLHKLGIFTLKELASYPLANLLNQFGIMGYELHRLANFDLSRPLATLPSSGESNDEDIKSIGHSYTLPRPIKEIGEIKKLMLKLAEKIGRRMRRKNARGNVIHYFHSDKRYEWFSRQHKISEFINDGGEIYRAAWRVFASSIISSPGEGRVRERLLAGQTGQVDDLSSFLSPRLERGAIKILGLSVSGLLFQNPPEPLLPQYKKPTQVVAVIDKINDKYGEFTIRRGRLLGIPEEWGKDTVGFGRMKEI